MDVRVGLKESWALKNWCLWSVVLEKTLEIPLDCKEILQSILKEINPEYSLEGLMLKLKLQCFGHLLRRTDSFEKTLMLGKIEGRWLDLGKIGEGVGGWWGGWMASLTQLTWVWVNSGVGVGLGGLVCCCPGACRVGHDWVNYLTN